MADIAMLYQISLLPEVFCPCKSGWGLLLSKHQTPSFQNTLSDLDFKNAECYDFS